MSQSDFKYLLNLSQYPSLTSPWDIRGAKTPENPCSLGKKANKFLAKYQLSFDYPLDNVEAFLKEYPTFSTDTTLDVLAEFLYLKFFAVADFFDIDKEIQDVWLNWQNARNGRSTHNLPVKEYSSVIEQVALILNTETFDDEEYGRFIREQWIPLANKLQSLTNELQKILPSQKEIKQPYELFSFCTEKIG